MKNSTFMKLFLMAGAFLFTMQNANSQSLADSVEMGASYPNDVYYNIENGATTVVDRLNWDIGFTTASFDMNIITNDGAGVMLYTYPKGDTADWNTVDTSGLSTWTPMFNDDTDWNWGAFAINAKGHPDYGWGVYNDINHNVVGDSLFIIQTKDGTWKKLWVEQLVSTAITFQFKYADLDGSNEQTAEVVAADYPTKNFIYYDLTNNEVVDREPAKTDWNLMFTRWVSADYLPTIQKVAGVFQNKNVEVAELRGFDIAGDTCYMDADFSGEKNVIGYDWKAFSMATFAYAMEDSLVYFVKTANDMIYELNWDAFDYTIAQFKFHKELLNPAAPTSPVIDDLANTFGWTENPDFLDIADYEYITVNDTAWMPVTANPQPIPAGEYAAGDVKVRVKADETNCRPYSIALSNDVAFTGIKDVVSNNIQFSTYPNPATDYLTVSLTGNNVKIEVYNMIGALVFETGVSNMKTYNISTADFANGTYMIKVKSDNNTGSKLFVVNK
ncbi:MAG: T9SS type A sorting domain-containing protein [Chlorobi bacterium]|nr:T9SS type A sorting domain-containing protein [Chlorobiota bacterium]